MGTVIVNKRDELIMKLVHYFVTEQNYNPIIVNGVKDEIWLENADGPYRIIRINSNNIFNEEQLDFDYFKIENIVHQIKKKTFSWHVNTLNILLNVNEDLKVEGTKYISPAPIFNDDIEIKDKNILEAFPNINEKLLNNTDGIDLIINVTKDINEKTSKENESYEKTFSPKKILITPIIIALCIAAFIFTIVKFGIGSISSISALDLLSIGANFSVALKAGQFWRLITYMFLHGNLIHLVLNMYSLYIIGNQIENFFGKTKYLIIYFVSGICAGLLSAALNDVVAVGASGAIFGLMGALLYFGYVYRNYLGEAIKSRILPVIIINLAYGFMVPGIDNAGHIGGLVGGFLITMAIGIAGKTKTSEKVGGIISLLALIGTLIFLILK